MTSLLDIGPLTEEVKLGSKSVTVHGVTPEGFFYLLAKFPALQNMFGAKAVDPDGIKAVAPEALAYALAVATTDRGDFDSAKKWTETIELAARKAMNLAAHHQMALFEAAIRLTFPDGVGPFMKAVMDLADAMNRTTGKAPATTSSKRSRSGFTKDSPGMRLGPGRPSASSQH